MTRRTSRTGSLAMVWLVLAAMAWNADAQGGPGDKKRYRIGSGAGWRVCEAYVRHLNSTAASAPPVTCDLRLHEVPGMKAPAWQDLPIEKHLDWVHQMELRVGRMYVEPEPLVDFEKWKIQREQRVRERQQQPRLRIARTVVTHLDPSRTVLYYEVDTGTCARKALAGSPSMVGDLGLPYWFVLDETAQRITRPLHSSFFWQGELGYYEGRPYFVLQDFGNPVEAVLFVTRMLPMTAPAIGVEPRPYYAHEICRITYPNPFPPTR